MQVLGDLTDWSYEVTPRNEIAIRVQTTLRIPSCNSAPERDLVWVRRKKISAATLSRLMSCYLLKWPNRR
jgi:hypothetical protein